MDFSDVFVPVDTIRLDAGVLVGSIQYLDVSGTGELLISDRVARDFKVFSDQGSFIRTLQTNDCSPGTQIGPISARFIGGGRILALTHEGVFAFDANGVCEQHKRDFVHRAYSFCERNDSLFVFAVSRTVPQVHVYTESLELLEAFPTEAPVRPQLTSIFRGMVGRDIACLERGAYYVYPERSDARLVDAEGVSVVHEPPFFKAPTRDRGSGTAMGDRFSGGEELWKESTLNLGVFELDTDIRMVAFNATRHARSVTIGSNIVGPDERSVSTYLTKPPVGAANGFLYLFGDNEQLESGDIGNRMIEKYRFIESTLQ